MKMFANMLELKVHPLNPNTGAPDSSSTETIWINVDFITMIAPIQIQSAVIGVTKNVTCINVAFAAPFVAAMSLNEFELQFMLAKRNAKN